MPISAPQIRALLRASATLVLVSSLTLCASIASPQKTPPQQQIKVLVLNANFHPARPVQSVRISLTYIDGSSRITEARSVTSTQGETWIELSPDIISRADLRIEITGVSDLVLFDPADGQLSSLPTTITVKLLPKGSPALLEPTQIEAMLRRLSLSVKNLQSQNRTLQSQLSAEQYRQPDLDSAMEQWAIDNGFDKSLADTKIRQWAQEIEIRKDLKNKQQLALAELALKHYDQAALLFKQLFDARTQARNQKQETYLKEIRKDLSDTLDAASQSASTYQLASRYHDATSVFEQALADASSERAHYPDDIVLHQIWLIAIEHLADARMSEGEVASASESLPLLAQSIDDYRRLASDSLFINNPENRATLQINLGNAFNAEGERVSGMNAAALLDLAIQSYQNALQFYTKTDHPAQWATTQLSIGTASARKANIVGGEDSSALFAQAYQSFQNALLVLNKSDSPQSWAAANTDLGDILVDKAKRETGETATGLLNQSILAFNKTLELYTQSAQPQDWARTQDNLGNAFLELAKDQPDSQAAASLNLSHQAFQNALLIYKQDTMPQDWARTQNNFGNTLLEEAERADGQQAAMLLDQAVQAFENSLEVFHQSDLPQDWARAQLNLGVAYGDEARLVSGDLAASLLDKAAQSFKKTLAVNTKESLPQGWAMTQNNIGYTLMQEAQNTSAEKAAPLLEQAIQSFQSALEVFTQTSQPQYWTQIQNNLRKARALQVALSK